MKIQLQKVRQAYKKIGFKPITYVNMNYIDGECCPLAALSLEKQWDKIQKDIKKYRDKFIDKNNYIDNMHYFDASKDLLAIDDGQFKKYTKLSDPFISGFMNGFDDSPDDTIAIDRYNKKQLIEYNEGRKNGKHIRKYLIKGN